jgi:hypothetical protein
VRVVARFVTHIDGEVEDLLHRTLDDDLALDVEHVVPLHAA